MIRMMICSMVSWLILVMGVPGFASSPSGPVETTGRQDSLLQEFRTANRILFLGDSITYAGGYVAEFEGWWIRREGNDTKVVLNAGLPSETVSGLSEAGHAGGRFPRPDLAERLERVLEVARPDMVIACYGINCGVYQPFDEERFGSYQRGINNLISKVSARGAKLVLVTPPVFDDHQHKKEFDYNQVLGRYSEWLVQQRGRVAAVIDLHSAMSSELERRRASDPQFTFQPDSVHPSTAGHRLIATVLARAFDKRITELPSGPQVETLQDKVRRRMVINRDALLTAAGHRRPGIAQGLSMEKATAEIEKITEQIRSLLGKAHDPVHVGVYYYPWYIKGDWSRHEYPGSPLLGKYGTDSSETARQHIEWCADHGIDSLFVSWWREDNICARHMNAGLLQAPNLNRIKFALFYESLGLLDDKDGKRDSVVDFGKPAVMKALVEDFQLMAKKYFGHPQYLRFNNRPVVGMYVTRTFRGFTPQHVQQLRDATGMDLFLIGDEVFFGRQGSPGTARHGHCFDMYTAYNMLANPQAVEGESSMQYHQRMAFPVYRQWASSSRFAPGVFPSYQDFRGNKKLVGTPDQFEQLLEATAKYASDRSDGVPPTVLITSFNEWWEGTTIEPSQAHGNGYLKAIRKFKSRATGE